MLPAGFCFPQGSFNYMRKLLNKGENFLLVGHKFRVEVVGGREGRAVALSRCVANAVGAQKIVRD